MSRLATSGYDDDDWRTTQAKAHKKTQRGSQRPPGRSQRQHVRKRKWPSNPPTPPTHPPHPHWEVTGEPLDPLHCPVGISGKCPWGSPVGRVKQRSAAQRLALPASGVPDARPRARARACRGSPLSRCRCRCRYPLPD
jgi:hypothetical protein